MDVGKGEELGPRKQSPHSSSMRAQVMIRYGPGLTCTVNSFLDLNSCLFRVPCLCLFSTWSSITPYNTLGRAGKVLLSSKDLNSSFFLWNSTEIQSNGVIKYRKLGTSPKAILSKEAAMCLRKWKAALLEPTLLFSTDQKQGWTKMNYALTRPPCGHVWNKANPQPQKWWNTLILWSAWVPAASLPMTTQAWL